jgi:glycosyltransferase involved in cell wall biosynthesis
MIENKSNISAPDISVVICAYTEKRWDELNAAVASIKNQTLAAREIILVIDNNLELLERARDELTGVIVTQNQEQPGLSGARNSGVAISRGSVIAFMDEDAVAEPDWLATIREGYRDPNVIGVGGAIDPIWVDGQPDWFPEEFNWVVGCSYRGMPTEVSPVRNLIGCNMSFRRDVLEAHEGFRHGIGRIGSRPLGCEETELCIRIGASISDGVLLYNPAALVNHRVPEARKKFRYYLSRCYSEGLSKALISRLVGANKGLASERAHALKTLPIGVIQGLQDVYQRKEPSGILRAGAIIIGLASTSTGYVVGSLSQWIKPHPAAPEASSPRNSKGSISTPKDVGFEPIRLLEVALENPLPDLLPEKSASGEVYKRGRALARVQGQLLGIVNLKLDQGGLTAQELADQIWKALDGEINDYLQEGGFPQVALLDSTGLGVSVASDYEGDRDRAPENLPYVEIVIATHDRTESLAATIESLLGIDYPDFGIIVVDNAPSTNTTEDLIQQTCNKHNQIRYIREDHPGLAVAHNRGLLEVDAPIVAFIDDDVLVDNNWLREIVAGFEESEDVACVTGMILPVELETQAQVWIEDYWGLSKGFMPVNYCLSNDHSNHPLFPYTAGQFGSGANMAFSTFVLREIGGFDPALGAGSKALGGDDLAAFFNIINSGYSLNYQPSAIVYHHHRRDEPNLQKLAYGYGVGLTAYLTSIFINNPKVIFDFVPKIPSGVKYALDLRSPKAQSEDKKYPRKLTALERKGMIYGPFAYLRSRWKCRNLQTTPLPDSQKVGNSSQPPSWADDVSST